MNRCILRGAVGLLATLAAWPVPGLASGVVVDLSAHPVPALVGSAAEEQFGYATAAGDFDGDGDLELAVGAPGGNPEGGAYHTGTVYLFETAALRDLPDALGAGSAADLATVVIDGPRARARFGSTLAAADITGDGIDDLIVGAPEADDGSRLATGRVYVYPGGDLDGFRGAPDATAPLVLVGGASGHRLGSSLLTHDVDGDGTADLLLSAFRAGGGSNRWAGVIYLVDSDAIAEYSGQHAVSSIPHASIVGPAAGDALRGIGAGDLDGDGQAEIVAGAYQSDGAGERLVAGAAYVVPAAALAPGTELKLPEGSVSTVLGPDRRGHLGRSISIGDLDLDGMDDVLISAYGSRGKEKKIEANGEAFVLFGGEDGVGDVVDLKDAGVPRFRSRSRWDLFGLPVLVADLSGDGAADIIIAAQFADGPDRQRSRCGEVYVFLGSLKSVVEAKAGEPETADATIIGAHKRDALGGSLLVADLTGGASPDLLIGAPDADGGAGDSPRTGKLFLVPGERFSQ